MAEQFNVTEESYQHALSEMLDETALFGEEPVSSSSFGCAAFIAWAYDDAGVDKAAGVCLLSLLPSLHARHRDLILTVIIGRLRFGRRGSHPLAEEIYDFYFRFIRWGSTESVL
jgi:hypothetical protein